MSVDRFGIPDNVFGVHDEDFFGALGRVAALSALIEHEALGIYQTMANLPQATDAQLAANQLLKKAFNAVSSVGDDENKTTLHRYFTDVETVLHKRNNYIHNLWPAQPGDRLYGWRHSRDKNAPVDKQYEAMETSFEELKSFVLELVKLTQRRDRVYAAACVAQELKLRAEVVS